MERLAFDAFRNGSKHAIHSRRYPGHINLHVLERGSGDISCLLIHGLGDGAFVWRKAMELLPPNLHIVAVDLRGHGDSDWSSDGDYTIEKYCSDLDVLFDRNRARRWILAGHSLGAAVVVRLALSRSKQSMAVVVVDYAPAADTKTVEHIRQILRTRLGKRYQSVAEYRAEVQAGQPLTHATVLDEIAHGSLRPLRGGGFGHRSDPRIVDWSLAEERAGVQARLEEIGRITIPSLVVRGSGSALLSHVVAQQIAFQAFANGNFVTVPRSGHAVPTDNPNGLATAIRQFLIGLGLSGQQSDVVNDSV